MPYDDSFDRIGALIHNYGARTSDAIRESARARAEHALRQGQTINNAFQGLADMAGTAIKAKKEEKAQSALARQDAAFTARVQSGEPITLQDAVGVYGPQRGPAIYKAYAELQTDKPNVDAVVSGLEASSPPMRAQAWGTAREKIIKGNGIPAELVPEQYDDEWFSKFTASRKGKNEPMKLGKDDRLILDGKVIVDAMPDVKPTAMHKVTIPGPNGPVEKLVTEDELKAGVASYVAPKSNNDEPLVAIMGDSGEPVLVPRSQAAGKRPASNREQGRPVTSGDAGRIADFNTSLDDLKELGATLKGSKATGMAAEFGANVVPNAVTEFTGIGSEAKQKQAVIDRVKQVIGKTLEGGVLRAEDERKYSKILPTIGDPPAVVEAKLEGLRKAIEQRQSTFVESLGDAGYDTTRYNARQPGKPAAPPKKRNPFR